MGGTIRLLVDVSPNGPAASAFAAEAEATDGRPRQSRPRKHLLGGAIARFLSRLDLADTAGQHCGPQVCPRALGLSELNDINRPPQPAFPECSWSTPVEGLVSMHSLCPPIFPLACIFWSQGAAGLATRPSGATRASLDSSSRRPARLSGSVSCFSDTARDPDEVFLRFRIVDDGVGIPPDKVDEIFEAFVQADQVCMLHLQKQRG